MKLFSVNGGHKWLQKIIVNICQKQLRSTTAASAGTEDVIFSEHEPHIRSIFEHEFENVKPYSEVPGPKPIPILGNTWRLLPIIG